MMNKKGASMLGIVLGLFIFMMGVLFIPFITDDITTSRVDLDCTNTSITDGTKLTCLGIDIVIPYLIWLFVSLAMGLMTEDKFS